MIEPNRATLPHSPGANRGRVAKFLRLVMIEHSVFALPFAYISALTAMWQRTRSVHWCSTPMASGSPTFLKYCWELLNSWHQSGPGWR